MPKLHFYSFGSPRRYLKLSKQTLEEVAAIYPEAEHVALTASDLGDDGERLRKYARQHPKGYGYWRWKPLTLEFALRHSNQGDIIVYLDGRLGIPGRTVPWIDCLIRSTDLDMVAWQMGANPEYRWTTGDLLEFFGFPMESQEVESGQFAAGLYGVRNNQRTREFATIWRDVLENHGELCRDEISRRPNHPEFVENRHDQSAFSLIVKTLHQRGLSLRILTDEEMQGPDAIQPHAKAHPQRIPGARPLRKGFGRIRKIFLRRKTRA